MLFFLNVRFELYSLPFSNAPLFVSVLKAVLHNFTKHLHIVSWYGLHFVVTSLSPSFRHIWMAKFFWDRIWVLLRPAFLMHFQRTIARLCVENRSAWFYETPKSCMVVWFRPGCDVTSTPALASSGWLKNVFDIRFEFYSLPAFQRAIARPCVESRSA